MHVRYRSYIDNRINLIHNDYQYIRRADACGSALACIAMRKIDDGYVRFRSHSSASRAVKLTGYETYS